MTYIKKEQQSTPNINGRGHFLPLFLNKTHQGQLSCDKTGPLSSVFPLPLMLFGLL